MMLSYNTVLLIILAILFFIECSLGYIVYKWIKGDEFDEREHEKEIDE